jgi:hypothetical protein
MLKTRNSSTTRTLLSNPTLYILIPDGTNSGVDGDGEALPDADGLIDADGDTL